MAPPPPHRPRLLAILFAVFVTLPAVDLMVSIDPAPPIIEKRRPNLAPLVQCSLETLSAFPGAFEKYFGDRFGFRNSFLRISAYIDNVVLREVLNTRAMLGKNGWIYLSFANAIECYRATVPWSSDELSSWSRHLARRSGWVRSMDAEHLFVIAPNKHAIYPEFLPAGIDKVGAVNRHDRLLARLAEDHEVDYLDLRPALLAEKARQPVYHHTDSHWNEVGALIASLQILDWVKARFPAVRPVPFEAYRIHRESSDGLDLAQVLGVETLYGEDIPHPSSPDLGTFRASSYPEALLRRTEFQFPDRAIVTEVDDPTLPTLVMFRDSFSLSLVPFLAPYFRRAVYLWTPVADPAVLVAESPDLVISEMVERLLGDPVIQDPHPIGTHGLPPLRTSPDLTCAVPALTISGPQLETTIEEKPEPELMIRAKGPPVSVLLPEGWPSAGPGEIVLQLRAPSDTILVAFFKDSGDTAFGAGRSHWLGVLEGENLVRIPVPPMDDRGQIRLDLGRVAGDYLLREIQFFEQRTR